MLRFLTFNKFYYIYATSEYKTLKWSGVDYFDKVKSSSEKYGFIKCEMKSRVRKWIQSFSLSDN